MMKLNTKIKEREEKKNKMKDDKRKNINAKRRNFTNWKKSNEGITLIALVITIIVLLILAGVSIATLTGENGILTRASDAKIETIVATVKENLQLEEIEKAIDEEEVTPETMLAEGKVKRTVQQAEDGNYYMYYALKEDVVEGMQGLGKGNVASLRDVFLIDDDLNVKYIAKNGREYGDELEEKILKDETKIRFASKAFSEYVSKISGATEEEMKFEWMKNQTSLTITDTAVDSLEDLVFFPNLENLTLGDWSNNIPPITSMDGVENCTKLKSLTIISGPDKDYSALSELNNLLTFSRSMGDDYENILEALKFCNSLEELILNNVGINNINEIELLSDSIIRLDLSNNQIEDITKLKHFRKLKVLNLSNNKIKEIKGLENLKDLTNLNLQNNQISDITPLSMNTSLTILNLKGNTAIDGNKSNYTGERLEALNKIAEILDRGGTINIDTDKLGLFTNYKALDLSGQNLTTLEALEGLTQLTSLNLNANKLTLEDEKSQEILKSMKNLENLNIGNNQVTNIKAINNLGNLKLLYLQGNNNVNLVEIEDIISNLDLLTVSTQSLKTIVNCDINKITKLRLTNSSALTEIPDLSRFEKLKDLSLSSDSNIKDLSTISDITSLEILNLYNTNLHGRMIDFSKLTNLTNVDLRNNTLWSEDLENLKVLRNNTNLTIDLRNNSIIDATALLELNSNTKINLTGNINLSQDSKDKLKEHFGNNVTF